MVRFHDLFGYLVSEKENSRFILVVFAKTPHQVVQVTLSFPVVDPRGRSWHALPYSPKFSQFHAVFWKIWQNCMLVPPSGRLAPPPTRNPGSAPDSIELLFHTEYLADFLHFTFGRDSNNEIPSCWSENQPKTNSVLCSFLTQETSV